MKYAKALFLAALVMTLLSACAEQGDPGVGGDGDGAPPDDQPPMTEGLETVEESTPGTTEGAAAADGAGDPSYAEEVGDVVEDTSRRFAEVTGSGNGDPVPDAGAVESARAGTQEDLDRLRSLEPPAGFERAQEQLVVAYEEAISGYDSMVAAYDSGDASEISRSTTQDLPTVGEALDEARAISGEIQAEAPEDASG